jgi:prepilin-type N-terminal cleavage/methylation domain-containing protein
MKRTIKQFNKKAGFTIVELLTVMSIIVILIGLLVPALNMAKQYAKKLKQMAMFHSIDAALELFSNEFDGYPPSGALDSADPPESYCGAMKLCEAMMGQDLLGFHTNSIYKADGTDADGKQLYGLDVSDPLYDDNLKARRGPFLPLESANAYRLKDIYGTEVGDFYEENFVLCDVYTRNMLTGQKTGMPILYYKADTSKNLHDPNIAAPDPTSPNSNIYNYWDNQELILLGKPWVQGDPTLPEKKHNLAETDKFYKNTESPKIKTAHRPYRVDSYILLSAGFDGEYGTADDIFNFEWKYRAEE